MRRAAWIALVALAACGDDAPAPPPHGAGPAGGAGPAAAKKDDKDKLAARMHAEDKVVCPAPDKPTGPDCKPEAPTCDPGLYCIADALPPNAGSNATLKYSCEPCPEKDGIRHEFKDRDYIVDQVRDPFQSFVLVPADLGKPAEASKEPLGPCKRPDQLRATNYSYQDLRLVGMVGQGTTKTAVMMNSKNVGELIRRGDCVGKEKAVVADIVMHDLTACVYFQITAERADKGPRPPPREVPPVCLYPNGLPAVESQPVQPDEAPAGPQVAPPAPTGPQVAPPPSR
ncbi:MAG TPA: hypothetical protein VMJ10_35725 [Kofleriaceae bacterium]|nr:hypothetical protein [Kofleriaceae bacterium]